LFVGWLLTLIGTSGTAQAEQNLAQRVVIVANRADSDSIRIAQHYAHARQVPLGNIIALEMPQTETVSWDQFVDTIWNPLRAELVNRKWIDAIPMNLDDPAGRKKYSTMGHRIAYLVVCRGVPLRIRHSAAAYRAAPPMTDNVFFRTNAAAVDGEFSLLAQSSHEINAYLANPLFGNDHPSRIELGQVIKVSRLDGPAVEDVINAIEHAIAAERTGLEGRRAYVDIGGNHPDGDRWLEQVVRQLAELGIETDVDREASTFPAAARFDRLAFYFGWYAGTVNGPFTQPGFRFQPGAIAMHIHSFSAATLRDATSGWCGPFVARGVTATVGNVFEPYLQLTHRPDYLLRALARGANFGDAAMYAQRALSWQTVAIGDPLYQPFPAKSAHATKAQ
jgi:uncharacterized protein (TIGR03790 family)